MSAEQQQEGIQVAIRVRPLNERETSGGHSEAFQALVSQTRRVRRVRVSCLPLSRRGMRR